MVAREEKMVKKEKQKCTKWMDKSKSSRINDLPDNYYGGSSSKQEWVRGPSKLGKIFQQPPGSKLQLLWNGNDQPCGLERHPSLYSESIGVLIATSRRFDWTKSWDKQYSDQPNEEQAPKQPPREVRGQPKDWLWRKIKEYWEVDDNRKKYTITILGSELLSNKKSKWKKNHYSYYTYNEVVSNKPEQLSYQEWAILTEHWETQEHQVVFQQNKGIQVVFQQNKGNHAEQRAQHTFGRISFSQLREKINREQGVPQPKEISV